MENQTESTLGSGGQGLESTMRGSALLTRLDQLIALLSRPAVPADKELWDRSQVGAYLKLKPSALDRVLSAPGFPDARRPAGGHPRYLAAEVMAWVAKQK